MKEKVVLAYSGGLDTTAIIPWLKENFDYEVICCCIDCGQGEELDGLEERAKLSGASKLYIENIEKCIILFDEPELSLSIKWQNMFLPDVVNSGKCSTLIAVTHSPFIFDNEFDDLAKDMGNCLSENE